MADRIRKDSEGLGGVGMSFGLHSYFYTAPSLSFIFFASLSSLSLSLLRKRKLQEFDPKISNSSKNYFILYPNVHHDLDVLKKAQIGARLVKENHIAVVTVSKENGNCTN
jgi:hypothetical protein